MSSTEERRTIDLKFFTIPGRPFLVFVLVSLAWSSQVHAQQPSQGFAVERFYPSAPGSGWFVMDDLNIQGGLGGAVALTAGYAGDPLVETSPAGAPFSLLSNEVFVDFGLAVTYRRYRVSLHFPMPLVVSGTSGVVGPFPLTAPALSVGANPDTISDGRLGFDVRLVGEPSSALRLGAGAEVFIPFGDRADYVTDGTFRGVFRGLVAGDIGRFSYAGQIGFHVRSLREPEVPNGPNGNELLFGASVGRKICIGTRTVVVGSELFGETAVRSFFGESTGVEGLVTARFEGLGDGPHVRVKIGVGAGLDQHFGSPEWRIVAAVDLVARRSAP